MWDVADELAIRNSQSIPDDFCEESRSPLATCQIDWVKWRGVLEQVTMNDAGGETSVSPSDNLKL